MADKSGCKFEAGVDDLNLSTLTVISEEGLLLKYQNVHLELAGSSSHVSH